MKFLASDFDNTLYIKDGEKFTKNIMSLKDFISRGNMFCIITGRSYTSIKILLEKYNIPYTYLICEDGAKVFNSVDYCISSTMLPSQEVAKIKKVFEKNNIECFLEDGYNITENPDDCVKVLATYQDKNLANKVVDELQKTTNTYAYVSSKHINVTSRATNKKIALEELISKENLSKDNMYVIGDDINDYEMLQEFNGALMKNHHPKLSSLPKKEYKYFYEYIEELINN